MGPISLLLEQEGAIVIAWTLMMQECGLSVTL
jgi:hypothetical protein